MSLFDQTGSIDLSQAANMGASPSQNGVIVAETLDYVILSGGNKRRRLALVALGHREGFSA